MRECVCVRLCVCVRACLCVCRSCCNGTWMAKQTPRMMLTVSTADEMHGMERYLPGSW